MARAISYGSILNNGIRLVNYNFRDAGMIYDNIFSSIPVNKSTAVVTGQSGCSDNFLLPYRDQLKVLGIRKNEMSLISSSIKKEIGLAGRIYTGSSSKLPPYISNHPKFPIYMELKDALFQIERDIDDLKKKIKTTECESPSFQYKFTKKIKELYPDVYNEVKKILRSEYDENKL